MGFELQSDSAAARDFSFGYNGWAMLLELATRYGWEPRGTEPPGGIGDPNDWNGEYCSSDGQRVSTYDAQAMAAAIEKAVADPNVPAMLNQMVAEQRQGIAERSGPELAASFAGVKDFGEYLNCLRDFAEFCRDGSFRIE